MNSLILRFTFISSLLSLVACSQGFKAVRPLSQETSSSLSSALAITEPAAQSNSKGQILVKGKCDSGSSLSISGNIVAPINVSCSLDEFQASVELIAPDGVKNIKVTQTSP